MGTNILYSTVSASVLRDLGTKDKQLEEATFWGFLEWGGPCNQLFVHGYLLSCLILMWRVPRTEFTALDSEPQLFLCSESLLLYPHVGATLQIQDSQSQRPWTLRDL